MSIARDAATVEVRETQHIEDIDASGPSNEDPQDESNGGDILDEIYAELFADGQDEKGASIASSECETLADTQGSDANADSALEAAMSALKLEDNKPRRPSRAKLIARAREQEQNAHLVTEKLPPSKRAARVKAVKKQVLCKKAEEKVKARLEKKRKDAEAIKAQQQTDNDLVELLASVGGYHIVNVKTLEASIPVDMLKELPEDYYLMSNAGKYSECIRLLAHAPGADPQDLFTGNDRLIEDITDLGIEMGGENLAMVMSGANGSVLEKYAQVHDGGGYEAGESAIICEAGTDGAEQPGEDQPGEAVVE